jgi:hypothetical protein
MGAKTRNSAAMSAETIIIMSRLGLEELFVGRYCLNWLGIMIFWIPFSRQGSVPSISWML